MKIFLDSSVYSCLLFWISSASVRSIPFLSSLVPILAWNVPLVSWIFLKRSLDFPILLFSCICFHGSLRKAFLPLLGILWNSAFRWVYISFFSLFLLSLIFSAICKAYWANCFALFHCFFLGIVLIMASRTMSWTSLHSSFNSVVQSCPTICNPMNCSMPSLPVHYQLPEFTQIHFHRIGDAIHPSHPLPTPSPPAPNPSQHQSLFQWVNTLHQVAKVLEFQFQHQSF